MRHTRFDVPADPGPHCRPVSAKGEDLPRLELAPGAHWTRIICDPFVVWRLDLCLQILDRIAGRSSTDGKDLPHLELGPDAPVALLVNSLGATTQMELYVAAQAALAHARERLQVGTVAGDRIAAGTISVNFPLNGAACISTAVL